ncbi:MAG: virulence factor family protein, partial [Chitinophagaceae bacterium]|nr:virulence factor family protein [Chitinophagaceae bacterium]
GSLPVKEWTTSNSAKPLVLYITGDGGLNHFSTQLCNTLFASGYDVLALNARSYFWEKKTPQQTAAAISSYLSAKLNTKADRTVVLVGYSFGADVMPFIVNHLATVIQQKLSSVVLLSPSSSTDFEIHVSDMWGESKTRAMNVVAEINRMASPKTLIIFGADEDGVLSPEIQLKNVTIQTLPGSHHFDGNISEVVAAIRRYF